MIFSFEKQSITILHENGVLPLLIQNYLNSIVKQTTTQISQKGSIDIENVDSIFIIHSFSILIAILIQGLMFFTKKSVVLKTFKINFFNLLKKLKIPKTQQVCENIRKNSLEIVDLDEQNDLERF